MLAGLKSLNWKLFSGFLLLGLSSGLFLGSLRVSVASASGPGQNHQINYLFAVVSDEEGGVATLQALWLAATQPASGRVSWVPIYPQPLSDGEGGRSPRYSQAHQAIRLSGGVDGLIGLPLLRDLGVRWDEAFILDQAAADQAGGLLGAETRASDSVQSAVEPQLALQQQVRFIQAFCGANAHLSAPGTLDTVLALYPDHFRSSLNLFEIIALWDQLAGRDFSLSCDHPWAE